MKKRNSNFELLRIVSMLMIVAHHYSVHGQFTPIYGISINNMIIDFLFLGGKIGVILFIMISGYHIVHSTINFKKIIKLELEILLYSIPIFLFFYYFPIKSIGILQLSSIKYSIFPTIYSTYWFATTYFMLYLFIPYINKLLLSLSKKEYTNMLIIGFILFTIIPTFAKTDLSVGNLIYFIYFYAIGAYFKIFPKVHKKRWCFLSSTILYMILFLLTIIFQYISSKNNIYSSYIYHFASINSILVLAISISIFLLFKNLKFKNSKFINIIASSTFGIYLLHDNPYMRQFLWVTLFKNNTYYQSNYLLIHAIIVILIVFICSTMIDLIKKYIFERNIFRFVNIYKKIKTNKS